MSNSKSDRITYEEWIADPETVPFPPLWTYCSECGKIMSDVKTRHWSHDHSYSTGYTLVSTCVWCGHVEVYHDVE